MKKIIATMAAAGLAAGWTLAANAQAAERDETVVDTEWEEYHEWFDASRPDNWFASRDRNQDGLIDEDVFEDSLAAGDLEPHDRDAGAQTNDDVLWGLFGIVD